MADDRLLPPRKRSKKRFVGALRRRRFLDSLARRRMRAACKPSNTEHDPAPLGSVDNPIRGRNLPSLKEIWIDHLLCLAMAVPDEDDPYYKRALDDVASYVGDADRGELTSRIRVAQGVVREAQRMRRAAAYLVERGDPELEHSLSALKAHASRMLLGLPGSVPLEIRRREFAALVDTAVSDRADGSIEALKIALRWLDPSCNVDASILRREIERLRKRTPPYALQRMAAIVAVAIDTFGDRNNKALELSLQDLVNRSEKRFRAAEDKFREEV